MLIRLLVEGARVSLICEELGFDHWRPPELLGSAAIMSSYAVARGARGDYDLRMGYQRGVGPASLYRCWFSDSFKSPLFRFHLM